MSIENIFFTYFEFANPFFTWKKVCYKNICNKPFINDCCGINVQLDVRVPALLCAMQKSIKTT